MMEAISVISAVPIARLVSAGVPKRRPEVPRAVGVGRGAVAVQGDICLAHCRLRLASRKAVVSDVGEA